MTNFLFFHKFYAFWLGLLLCALPPANAQAEPRIALIVGNGGYSSVTSLDNPVSDAELMAKTLEARGFEVTLLTDATQITLNRGIAQFGRDLRAAGTDATVYQSDRNRTFVSEPTAAAIC